MTPTIDRVVYSQLIAKVAPKIIETETEYELVLAEIEKLLFNKNRTREEDAVYDLLVMLVEKYETENHPLNEVTPSQILQHLMDARAMTESDLVKILGNPEIVTAILHDDCLITISQAEVLAKYFQVSPNLFVKTIKSGNR
jgi:HTH-type transcriptional regulator/antitoxin HigA